MVILPLGRNQRSRGARLWEKVPRGALVLLGDPARREGLDCAVELQDWSPKPYEEGMVTVRGESAQVK